MARRSPGLLAALLLCAVAATACGGAGEANPRQIGPRGVDELVIPTTDPDPSDFVGSVDNQWLPLAPGTRWTYEVSGSAMSVLAVEVEGEPEVVHGVPCVAVRQTGTDHNGKVVYESVTQYAQDQRGNVWLLGERTEHVVAATRGLDRFWAALDHSGQGGLAMPATPRVGDGYVRAASGAGIDRSTVVSLDEERALPAGTFAGVLVVEDVVEDHSGTETLQRAYAAGVGLVEQTALSGGSLHLELVEALTPAGPLARLGAG